MVMKYKLNILNFSKSDKISKTGENKLKGETMQNKKIKDIRVVFIFALLFLFIFTPITPAISVLKAEEMKFYSPPVSSENRPMENPIELESKRTLFSKTTLNPDGTYRLETYPYPINCFDEKGNLVPIENDLIEGISKGKNPILKNKRGIFNLQIPFTLLDNYITLSFLDSEISVAFLQDNPGKIKKSFDIAMFTNPPEVSKNVCEFKSKETNASIRYEVKNWGIKESLVLESPPLEDSITFLIKAKGISKAEVLQNTAIFKDEHSRAIYFLPAPFAIDANNQIKDFKFTFSDLGKGMYTYTILFDTDWLKDVHTKYPVTIDPTVSVYAESCIYTNGSNYGQGLKVGDGYSTYLKYNLPDIPKLSIVTFAGVEVTPENPFICDCDSPEECEHNRISYTITAKRITSQWTADNITNKVYPSIDDEIIGTVSGEIHCPGSMAYESPVYLDIKNVVSYWLTHPDNNFGLFLEGQGGPIYGDMPPLVIVYNMELGISKLYANPSKKLTDRVTLYTSIRSGNLAISTLDFAIPGKDGLTALLTKTYNSQSDAITPFGYGWTSNILQSISLSDVYGSYITYKGADGSVIGFVRNVLDLGYSQDGPIIGYFASPGSHLKCKAYYSNGTVYQYTVSTLDGVTAVFSRNPPYSLQKLYTRDGGEIDFYYAYNGSSWQLSSVSNKVGSMTIHYNQSGFIDSITLTGNAAYPSQTRTFHYVYDSNGNLISETDPLGNTTRYSYDSNHNLISITDPLGHTTYISYSSRDTIDTITFANGARETFTPISPIDATISGPDSLSAGQSGSFTVSVTGGVPPYTYIWSTSGLQSQNGNSATYNWTDSGTYFVTAIVKGSNGEGVKVQKTVVVESSSPYPRDPPEFDSTGNHSFKLLSTSARSALDQFTYIASLRDESNNNWTYTFDSFANLLSKRDPLGNITSFTYDPKTYNILSITDPLGNTTTYTYDEGYETYNGVNYDKSGNLLTETDPLGNTTRYTYSLGRIKTKTTPLGFTTTYNYTDNPQNGPSNNPTSIIDPLGRTTTFTYDPGHRLISKTEPFNGSQTKTTQYTYDNYDFITSETDPEGNVTRYTHDALGNLIAVTDPLNNTTTYEYDLVGRIVKVTDPEGKSTTYTYDGNGNKTSETDSMGHTTHYEYDSMNRLIRVIDPLGNVTTYTYDAKGNLISRRDPLGNIITLQYDARDLLIQYVDEKGKVTNYTYDRAGHLISVSDNLGTLRTYTYDANGRVTSKTENGKTTSFTYDADGRLTSKLDPNGKRINYTYNGVNLPTNASYPDGTSVNVSYELDNLPVTLSSPSGNLSFTYNKVGLPITSTDVFSLTSSYTYDGSKRMTSRQNTVGVTSFFYNRRSDLVSMRDPQNDTTYFTYDDARHLTKISYPNPLHTDYTYDNAGRVTGITLSNTMNIPSLSLSYTYNARNQITAMQLDGRTTSYTYNPDGSLSSVTYPDNTTESYQYDSRGNILKVTNKEGTKTFTYNSENQITTLSTPSYTVSFTYDNNGNLISQTTPQGSITYSYNFDNRLKQVTLQDGTVIKYSYDAQGRLVSKDKNGIKRNFHYDVTGLYRIDGDINISFITTATGTPIAMLYNGNKYFFHFNSHGDTVALSDSNGVIVAKYTYSPYGTLLSEYNPNNIPDPLLYVGEYGVIYDSDTNLYLMGARWYSPTLMRFLTKDPYPENIQEPITFNAYQYCENDPVNKIDPTGMAAITQHSYIPPDVLEEIKEKSGIKDLTEEDVVFALWYYGKEDGKLHLVGFKLTDKYGGKEMWFNKAGEATKNQGDIANNIRDALQSESGLHAYVKEGYAVRLQWYKNFLGRKTFIFKLYHILPETTFNWFRIVHKAEIDKYVFKETSKDYAVTHYTGVYLEFP